MVKLAIVFLGAGLGGTMRYLLQGWVQGVAGTAFPLGTLVVNVLGCFVLGLLLPLLIGPAALDDRYRLGLVVGVLGGFTTFSAFGVETLDLAAQRQFLLAAANIVLSMIMGPAGVWVGMQMATRWTAG